MAQALCDGPGDENVEDIQADRFEGVASYSNSLTATAEREIADDNGDPQKVSGDVSITLDVRTTVDEAGNLVEVQATASGSGQGQASNSQIDLYGIPCYSLVSASQAHDLGGATTADYFQVTGSPVRLDLQASLNFGQASGADGVVQTGRFTLYELSSGELLDVMTRMTQDDINLNES